MYISIILLSALASRYVAALPQQVVSGNEVTGTTCLDTSIEFDFHDTNVAILGICGGIAGSIQKCGGNPISTTGVSNNSKFTLDVTVSLASPSLT